jgi:hypothetical protein
LRHQSWATAITSVVLILSSSCLPIALAKFATEFEKRSSKRGGGEKPGGFTFSSLAVPADEVGRIVGVDWALSMVGDALADILEGSLLVQREVERLTVCLEERNHGT